MIVSMLLFSFTLGTVILDNGFNVLPLGLHTALFAIPFFGIGYMSKNIPNSIINSSLYNRVLLMIGCFSVQLICLGYYSGSIEKSTLAYIPLALVGVTLYFVLSIQINKNGILEFLGMNSLVILAFQEQSYRAVIYFFSKLLTVDVELIRNNIFFCITISIFTILIILPIIYFYNKYIKPNISKLFEEYKV